MKVLANIDARIISKAIDKTSPLTLNGKTAVSNYRHFINANTMTATGLEASITSLINLNDAGLESFINTLKGLMPEAKRKVAVAYEMLQYEPKNSLFNVGTEAEEALAMLYKHNAAKIIDEINEGVLDPYKTNPVISSLISYAKAAVRDVVSEKPLESRGSAIANKLVPVLNIASLGETGMLVSIDNILFIRGERGGLSNVTDFSVIDSIPSDVKVLINCIRLMDIDAKQPNVLKLNDELTAVASKHLGVKEFKIDLLGTYDDCVVINGVAMSNEKALQILNANIDSIAANIISSEQAKEILTTFNKMIDIFGQYRGSILTGSYAYRFEYDDFITYVVKFNNVYSCVVTTSGTVINATKYDTIYSLLADSHVITSTELQNAISSVFKEDLKSEVNTSTIKQSLLKKMIKERDDYEDLLKKIRANQTELAEMSDANPEKVEELDKIEKKVSANLKQINEEIDKLKQ